MSQDNNKLKEMGIISDENYDKYLERTAKAQELLKKVDVMLNNGFKKLGKGTIIYDFAKIVKREVIEIGDNCKIDDFTFIYGGEGVKIGNNTHLGSFTSIIGGGSISIGKYVGISQGVRLATGTNDYRVKGHLTAAAPLEEQAFYHGHIEIEDEVLILSNAVVVPNVKIGKGAVVGALSLVNKDLEPWTVYAGIPCRKIGVREPL